MRCSRFIRFLTRFRMVVCGHVLNPLFYSRVRRRRLRNEAFGDILCGYFRRYYLGEAEKVFSEPGRAGRTGEAASRNRERIFSLWLQGEESAPQLVRTCFESVRRNCPDMEFIVLDASNISEYITLPETIVRKYRNGAIRHCHFADICRVELLRKYGGYWIDATCFMTAPIPARVRDCDFFVYMAPGSYSYIQNCFIRAVKGSALLEAWSRMILKYWEEQDSYIDYFMHQVMFRTIVGHLPEAGKLFDLMPETDQEPTHLLWYHKGDEPYRQEVVDTLTQEGFFFQKTSHHDKGEPHPGSFKHYLTYGKID